MAGPTTQEPLKTQQKCIATLALLCCFTVLMVLIFSSVDIWGDDEDGITEENCSRDCRIILVENIPDELSLPMDGRRHLPLSLGFHSLLDQAKHSVEVVSSVWNLNSWDVEPKPSTANQGQLLFQKLLSLKSRGVKLKIVSSRTNTTELKALEVRNAEVHSVNMTALTKGGLHSSFWIVDRKHIYIGSADMDWRSFSEKKELGVVVYNCSCLALDLHRVFSFYWQLHDRDYIPSIWSKRVTALYGKHEALELQLNATPATAYVSKFFSHKEQKGDFQLGLNHNKYMVTDNAVYIGNHDWVGSDFVIDAGVGLVLKMKESPKDREVTVLENIKAAFERDWRSRYAKNLQKSKDHQGKYRNLQWSKNHWDMPEENDWNKPL